MVHNNAFLTLVKEAQPRVKEIDLQEAVEKSHQPGAVLVDVREDHEWIHGRAAGAVHLGKGIIERDIEATYPDATTPLLCYCGGGYRSVLVADALQKMGYTNVFSVIGGYKAWKDAGLPIEK